MIPLAERGVRLASAAAGLVELVVELVEEPAAEPAAAHGNTELASETPVGAEAAP